MLDYGWKACRRCPYPLVLGPTPESPSASKNTKGLSTATSKYVFSSHIFSRLLHILRADCERRGSSLCRPVSGNDSIEEDLERLKLEIEVRFMFLLLSERRA